MKVGVEGTPFFGNLTGVGQYSSRLIDAAILLSSSEQLADGMIKLLGDPDKSRTMIAKGYAQAKKFSWERTVSGILTAISEVGEQ